MRLQVGYKGCGTAAGRVSGMVQEVYGVPYGGSAKDAHLTEKDECIYGVPYRANDCHIDPLSPLLSYTLLWTPFAAAACQLWPFIDSVLDIGHPLQPGAGLAKRRPEQGITLTVSITAKRGQ